MLSLAILVSTVLAIEPIEQRQEEHHKIEVTRKIADFRVCLFDRASHWTMTSLPQSTVAEKAWQGCVASQYDFFPDEDADWRQDYSDVLRRYEMPVLRQFIKELRLKRERDDVRVIDQ